MTFANWNVNRMVSARLTQYLPRGSTFSASLDWPPGRSPPKCESWCMRQTSDAVQNFSKIGSATVTAEFVVRLLYNTVSPGALHSQYAVRKRKDFRLRLNVAVDDRMSFSYVGRRFHARGAATENARVTNSPLGSWLEEVAVAGVSLCPRWRLTTLWTSPTPIDFSW